MRQDRAPTCNVDIFAGNPTEGISFYTKWKIEVQERITQAAQEQVEGSNIEFVDHLQLQSLHCEVKVLEEIITGYEAIQEISDHIAKLNKKMNGLNSSEEKERREIMAEVSRLSNQIRVIFAKVRQREFALEGQKHGIPPDTRTFVPGRVIPRDLLETLRRKPDSSKLSPLVDELRREANQSLPQDTNQ